MAHVDSKALAPYGNAIASADGKYNETITKVTHIEDSPTRVITARTLIDMLELEIKTAKERIGYLKSQRWQREETPPAEPEPEPEEPDAPPPGTPPAPEHRESLWNGGEVVRMAAEDFDRLSGLDIQRQLREEKVGETILQQMGGWNKIRAMLGAKAAQLPNGVVLQWPNKTPTKGNVVEITLAGDDTYTMKFFNARAGSKKLVKEFTGIYWDQLKPTFERQTGWRLSL